MKHQKVNILGDSVTLTISKPTLRSDQISQRILRAFLAVGRLQIDSKYSQTIIEWDFAAMLSRLQKVEFEPVTFRQSPDLQEFALWVEQWTAVTWDNADSVNALFESYLDLHIDIADAWKTADKQVATDLIIAQREQLPTSQMTDDERLALANEDSPLVTSAKTTA